jgi:hypothetical protein
MLLAVAPTGQIPFVRWLGAVSALVAGLTTAPAWAQGNFEIHKFGHQKHDTN